MGIDIITQKREV